jgi:hypothetical protein
MDIAPSRVLICCEEELCSLAAALYLLHTYALGYSQFERSTHQTSSAQRLCMKNLFLTRESAFVVAASSTPQGAWRVILK